MGKSSSHGSDWRARLVERPIIAPEILLGLAQEMVDANRVDYANVARVVKINAPAHLDNPSRERDWSLGWVLGATLHLFNRSSAWEKLISTQRLGGRILESVRKDIQNEVAYSMKMKFNANPELSTACLHLDAALRKLSMGHEPTGHPGKLDAEGVARLIVDVWEPLAESFAGRVRGASDRRSVAQESAAALLGRLHEDYPETRDRHAELVEVLIALLSSRKSPRSMAEEFFHEMLKSFPPARQLSVRQIHRHVERYDNLKQLLNEPPKPNEPS